MHNRVGPTEMFVAIPKEHFHFIAELIENFRIDPEKMRSLIMPSYSRTDNEVAQQH